MLIVEIQHANPYYDDSYAVNSANLGPYGDAITYELIPYLEKKYRGLGAGWARFMYGGSTGGWEALARRCSTPTSTTAAMPPARTRSTSAPTPSSNIYKDTNAYWAEGPVARRSRARGHRNYLGHVAATLRGDESARARARDEEPLGPAVGHLGSGLLAGRAPTAIRSAIWDKRTGVIDPEVAAYWHEHYDLVHILRRDWDKGLGQKLAGKIHIYVGDMDNYYLNNAVYLVEDFLKTATRTRLRRRGGLRRPRRALLERRPHARQRDLPAALPPDVPAEDREADAGDRAAGRRCHELALLTPVASRDGPLRPPA